MANKVVIIGDSNVGKTSILNRYIYNSFNDEAASTSVAGFKTKDVAFNEKGDTIKLHMWDTCG